MLSHRILLLSCLLFIAKVALAEKARLPIKLVDKLILIEGTVDGQTGYFMLDLGVSDLVLNNRYFTGIKSKNADAYGVNGTLTSLKTKWIGAEFGSLKWRRRLAHVLSLQHLEDSKGERILGLVGGQFFKKCQLTIDLRKMQVEIQQLGKEQFYNEFSKIYEEPEAILPFKYKGGMPWIEVHIGSVSYKFGLDTASEYSVMHEKWLPSLEPHLFNKRRVVSRGISATEKSVMSGKIGGLEIGTLKCYPMSTLFTDMGTINRNLAGANLDGLLGFDLLRQLKVVIDYDRREILVWRHSNAKDYPILITFGQQRDSLGFIRRE